MKLSVVIPCYNAADTIGIQLEALAKQRWSEPWEVIVADNRSNDGSRTIVEQYKERLPNLRVVDATARQGQPYALNTGIQAASSDAVAICDADDEVAPGWVAAMGESLAQYDFVACKIDVEKLNPTWTIEVIGRPQQQGLQQIWYPPYLPHAGGGTLGVKKSLHAAVGGFDEDLPYLHDTDFCFKLQLAGVQFHFVANAVIHIRYRHELSDIYRQALHWADYNVKVYKKYRLSTGMVFPQPWAQYMACWWRVVRRLRSIRHKQERARLIRGIGWQVGLLQGSIKYRVAPVPLKWAC